MQYTVTKLRISVLGKLWMGGTAATDYDLTQHDLNNMKGDDPEITREDVENWLLGHSGDFQSITDFAYDFSPHGPVGTWANEENELTYTDCMFPCEDE
jgi:hypothetical protein